MSRINSEPVIQAPEKIMIGDIQAGDLVALYFVQKEEGYKGTNTTKIVKRIFTVIGKYPAGVLLERNGIREFFTYWELDKKLRVPKRSGDAADKGKHSGKKQM